MEKCLAVPKISINFAKQMTKLSFFFKLPMSGESL